MQPNEPSPPPAVRPRAPRKSNAVGYVVSLVVVVAVIGVVAWVVQYLPSWKKAQKVAPPGQPPSGKVLLKFERDVAQWKNDIAGAEPASKDNPAYRDYEPGQKGHYDFPFKNVSGEDVEIVGFSSSCDCTSVQAGVIGADAWSRIQKAFAEKPADPLSYDAEPTWQELVKQQEWDKLTKDVKEQKRVLVKPDEGGIVRVRWTAKSAGQELRVMPVIAFQKPGDSRPTAQMLGVPLMVALPVRFFPPRTNVGVLTAGARATEEFHAWSSTRSDLDLKLTATPADVLFDLAMTPLSREECAELETKLQADPVLSTGKVPPRVLSASKFKITVHESKAGQQLDLGSFFRKLDVTLDGIPQRDVPGPEIVGRVRGEIVIGGADDQGRVRFKAFSAKEGATKTVELAADSRWQLETFKHDPSWITVQLTKDAVQDDPKRTIWRLQVTVPEDTPAAHSFEEPNAVILRIPGPPERFVRIPLEGHLSGR